MRRTQAERSATTQARVLEATCASLAELGYPGTTHAVICERAGVSRGALLHHFPTKAALMAAAVEHLFAQRHAAFRSALADLPSAGRLQAAFAQLWEIYGGPTLGAWQELVVASRTDPALREHVAAVNARFRADAEATFRALFGLPAAAPVGPALSLALAALDGLALNHVLEVDDTAARAALDELARLAGSWLPGGAP
ncbi:MAG: TetR/AcrR family transcriptional regulator [Planctomycetota bacterium]